MKQILVAVDEHPHAERIVETSIELARELASRILLIYVMPKTSPPENYKDTHGDALPEHYYEDEYERSLAPVLAKLQKSKVTFEKVLAVGDPQEEILKAAKSRRVSYIVVGARGLRGLRRLAAISSVSRGVIEKAEVPVLTVP
jgi:nucleotide-binding universal stress UspA family protein